MNTQEIAKTLATLVGELVDGAPASGGYMLNAGDPGLLRSLDRVPAAAASTPTATGSSIAAHVDHVRYGISLMNRHAARGTRDRAERHDRQHCPSRVSPRCNPADQFIAARTGRRQLVDSAREKTVAAGISERDEGSFSSRVRLSQQRLESRTAAERVELRPFR
jgi:hypothetical protein